MAKCQWSIFEETDSWLHNLFLIVSFIKFSGVSIARTRAWTKTGRRTWAGRTVTGISPASTSAIAASAWTWTRTSGIAPFSAISLLSLFISPCKFFLFFTSPLLLLLIGEGTDDLIGLFWIDCWDFEVKLQGLLLDVIKYCGDFDSLIIVDEYTSHESACLLIDVDSDVLDWAVLVEGFFYVLVAEVAIDVLDGETAVVL